MRQFAHYPIYINHADHWEDVRRRQIREFTAKHDARMVTWLRGTAKQLYEITEDKTPSAAARTFEDQVYDLLQKKIAVTTLGKMLLNGLKRSVQYWIVPLDAENERICQCGALTFPGKPKEGGGIRIYFNPTGRGRGQAPTMSCFTSWFMPTGSRASAMRPRTRRP